MKTLAILAVLVALSSDARAERFGFGAWLHYEVSGLRAIDDVPMATAKSTDLVLAGARLGGMFGKGRVGWAASFDFGLGSTIGDSGFLYEVSLLPIGVALRPSERSLVSLASGVAVSGAVGTLDDAVLLPVEALLEVSLGPVRVLARGRASWLAGADGRQDGAPSVTFADELEATVGVRLGWRYDAFGLRSGNGYFIGASYRELAGTRFAGLVIGYSLDSASRISRRSEW